MVLSCNNTDTLSKGQTLIRILMNENEIFVENNELPSSKEALHPSGTVQSKLTHSIFKSFNIEMTYLVFWSHVINVCKIKIDKYRLCDSMSPLFTFEIRQPPTSEHPVSLDDKAIFCSSGNVSVSSWSFQVR